MCGDDGDGGDANDYGEASLTGPPINIRSDSIVLNLIVESAHVNRVWLNDALHDAVATHIIELTQWQHINNHGTEL